jgi:hypothetical protein
MSGTLPTSRRNSAKQRLFLCQAVRMQGDAGRDLAPELQRETWERETWGKCFRITLSVSDCTVARLDGSILRTAKGSPARRVSTVRLVCDRGPITKIMSLSETGRDLLRWLRAG